MTVEEMLLALHDIQEPAAPAWWHLAPAWLLLIAVTLTATILIVLLRRWRRVNHNHALASRRLQTIRSDFAQRADTALLVLELSHWLKQVAMLAQPRRGIEGLTGRPWTEHLDEISGITEFTRGPGEIFAGQLYSAAPAVDAAALIDLCDRWLQAVKPRLNQPGPAS